MVTTHRQNKSSMKIHHCHNLLPWQPSWWQLNARTNLFFVMTYDNSSATINLQWKFITGKICYHGDKSSIKIHHCQNFVIMVTTHRHDKSSMKIHHRQHFLPCQYIMATNRRNKWLPWQIIAITTRHHDNRSHYTRI